MYKDKNKDKYKENSSTPYQMYTLSFRNMNGEEENGELMVIYNTVWW